MIDSSSYFKELFPRNTRTNSSIEFTQANMMVRFASNEGHIIGTNLFGYYLAYYLSSQRAKRFVW